VSLHMHSAPPYTPQTSRPSERASDVVVVAQHPSLRPATGRTFACPLLGSRRRLEVQLSRYHLWPLPAVDGNCTSRPVCICSISPPAVRALEVRWAESGVVQATCHPPLAVRWWGLAS
jgi:hypothetical protein